MTVQKTGNKKFHAQGLKPWGGGKTCPKSLTNPPQYQVFVKLTWHRLKRENQTKFDNIYMGEIKIKLKFKDVCFLEEQL